MTNPVTRRGKPPFSSDREKVITVLVSIGQESTAPGADEEMRALVSSAGGEVADSLQQHRSSPDPATFVGSGKVEEIRRAAAAAGAETLVFDHNLTPGQVSRLEEATGCKVIDRTELIMTIFADHARTAEAKLQIELAQLRYALPRLSGMWHHLSRLGGGIGTRGPGETQLEVDRRRARKRISMLEERMKRIEHRRVLRDERRRDVYRVVLTGYTNVGKSTLMNALCGADVRVEDRLFATLDTTTRKLGDLPGGAVVLSDTVGFIDRLPEQLVASFRSTLAVVREADLLLLVGDLSSPWRFEQMESVRSTLDDLGAGDIPRVTVWNKADLAGETPVEGLAVSALEGIGIDSLIRIIREARDSVLEWFDLRMESPGGAVVNWLFENCSVRSRTLLGGSTRIVAGAYRGRDAVRARMERESFSWHLEAIDGPPSAAMAETSGASDG